ncbi:MAG: sporulation initiation factor Spo0A C-terminal domain-containing protein [Clostridia bacterium]|nr:sporulation initiation factor Spo0A C-terminal domain-containing protein [Clostridia bacterium]
MDTKSIHELLLTLGIGRQYLGHNITAQAVALVMRDENSLLCVKKGIYMPIAAARQCDWRTVERNIRTVIHRAWTMHSDSLSRIAFYPLRHEPSVSEFLDILVSHLLRQHPLRMVR